MISMNDALRLIEERRGDAVVFPTSVGNRGWSEVTRDQSLDVPAGVMSKASSIALGLCLARPDRKVIVIDGDGSLLMNLGSLVTIGGAVPENLYHFVLDNGMYATTGGQPVPNAEGNDFAGLAKAAGYPRALVFDDLEEFATSVDEVMNAKGPVLVSLKTAPEIENLPIGLRPRAKTRRPKEAIRGLLEKLNR